MRASVLEDPVLVKRAGQFAWLEIDADKPSNAAFNAKFPSEGVPMFLIVDPATEKAALSWYGTATAAQLAALMDDGVRAIAGGASGPDAILAHADEANARKNYTDAIAFYEQALKAGGEKWPKRARVIESLIMAQAMSGKNAECLETARRDAPGMARDRSFVNVVYFGLSCAKAGTPESHEMEKLAEEAVKIPGVLSDDTSQLFGQLGYQYRAEKNEEAANRVGNEWVVYLRGQLAQAKSPDARMALDLQLVSAANLLKKPEIALDNLRRDERELPQDYNPPRVLANLLAQMGRYDDASAECGRALERAYGAPKLRQYLSCGAILERKGDKPAAKKMYESGIEFGRTLPENVAKPGLKALEGAVAKL